ncbi:hypothetical protein [Mesorhizobium australicum]|uniref:hypothetical protein n=1 Tax=Mesorhizobium australicum TaxID=536018 RepID=UPI0033359E69
MLSNHAERRCQSRGVRHDFICAILQHADIDRPIGGNCRLLRVSRNRARRLNIDDKLGRFAVIWSDENTQIVTVLPLSASASGKRYRKSQ